MEGAWSIHVSSVLSDVVGWCVDKMKGQDAIDFDGSASIESDKILQDLLFARCSPMLILKVFDEYGRVLNFNNIFFCR
jgi:hypothetical protein